MGQPFVGEIRMFGGNFAPLGWMFCAGQLISIAENDVLFQLIGTTYGGDGQTTFALPDLQSRVPVHQGNGIALGQNGGTETETLTTNQMPQHAHPPNASNTGGSDSPSGNVWANSTTGKPYVAVAGGVPAALNAAMVQSAGGGNPHDNMHPYLCVSYIISMYGIYPTPN